MNRLTEHDDQGNWCLKGVAWSQLHVGSVITKEVSEKLYGALCKLKGYEDTGLSPEEIMELKEFYSSPLNTAVPGIKFILNEDGVADLYDDTYDITIHCENKDQKDKLMERLSRCSWIPIEERFPENQEYILVSFGNFSVPDIARYERDDEGGAFYPGDEDYTYTSVGLFVNAWMPLPEPYKDGDNQ